MHWLKQSSVAFLVMLMSSMLSLAEDHTKDKVEDVLKAVKEKKAVIVDVREKGEWDRGHLKDAKLAPLSILSKPDKKAEIEEIQKNLPKDKVLYLHCGSGFRCLEAAPILRKLGYQVKALEPGYKALLEAGFEKAVEEKKQDEKKPEEKKPGA